MQTGALPRESVLRILLPGVKAQEGQQLGDLFSMAQSAALVLEVASAVSCVHR